METVAFVLNALLLYLMLSFLYRHFIKPKQEEKTKGEGEVNNSLKSEESKEITIEKKEEERRMVEDKICGCVIPRSESYIVVRDNVEHYFCSWDCRQKFIDS